MLNKNDQNESGNHFEVYKVASCLYATTGHKKYLNIALQIEIKGYPLNTRV